MKLPEGPSHQNTVQNQRRIMAITYKCVMDVIERLRLTAAAFGQESFLVLPDGHLIKLAEGHIPLPANFTFEDKAAKGLRKRKAEDNLEPPVYFSAL